MQRLILRFENCCLVITSISMGVMVVYTVADIFGRIRFFNFPMPGAVEINTMIMGAIVFFALGATQREGGQIRVDVLLKKFSERNQLRIERVISIISFFVFAFFSWRVIVAAIRSVKFSESGYAGTMIWPIYPTKILIAVGFVSLSIRLLIQCIRILGGAKSKTFIEDKQKVDQV